MYRCSYLKCHSVKSSFAQVVRAKFLTLKTSNGNIYLNSCELWTCRLPFLFVMVQVMLSNRRKCPPIINYSTVKRLYIKYVTNRTLSNSLLWHDWFKLACLSIQLASFFCNSNTKWHSSCYFDHWIAFVLHFSNYSYYYDNGCSEILFFHDLYLLKEYSFHRLVVVSFQLKCFSSFDFDDL